MNTTTLAMIALVMMTTCSTFCLVLVWRRQSKSVEPSEVPGELRDLNASIQRFEGRLAGQVATLDTRLGNLSTLFADGRLRGNWGEMALERILENAGMAKGRDYLVQHSTENGRPDVVLRISEGRTIAIDCKFPIARFEEAARASDESERRRLMAAHADELLRIGKELAGRRYSAEGAGGHTIMFLPHQGLFDQALDARPEVYEKLLAMGIVVTGPSGLVPIISAIAHVMSEQRAIQAASEIVEAARDVHSRIATWISHLSKVGKQLGAATKAYNEAVGSWEQRVAPATARLTDRLEATALPSPPEVAEPVRDISSRWATSA